MLDIVLKYNAYVDRLADLVKNSYYKAEYFTKSLGISEGTYYRKLKNKSFTHKEVTKLTQLLFPEELLLKALEEGKADLKNGKTYTHKEAREILAKKHGI